MNVRIGHRVMVTLLLVSGCGSGGAVTGNPGPDAGSAGATGGVAGGAGGEPAAGGGAGEAAGPGGAGGGSYDPGAAGAAGTGAAGGAGGATSSAGGGGETGDGGVAGATWLTPPPVAPALVAPNGASVKLHAHAVGAQIYTCTASAGADADGGANGDGGSTTYAWVLKAPDAKLYDSSGTQVGTHGAGPSWTWRDGSVANGVKVTGLPAPAADAIPWLLLRVTSTSGAGMLTDVSYVQRLSTVGGNAPATGCDATTVGTDTRSGYSAEYYFYTGGGTAAWLTAPSVPSTIAVPTDVRLQQHDHDIGVQIYNCAATAGVGATTYAWILRAPDAVLYDMTFAPVAALGEGPKWTSTDGSFVDAREIARADAPTPGAIPWLLVKELSTSGPGAFAEVAFVQRVNTAGGVAPATGCDASTVDTQIHVPYSADDYFYVSINQADAGAGD